MKKILLSLILIFTLLFVQVTSLFSFAGQKEVNPFSRMDEIRDLNIKVSLIDPKDSLDFEKMQTIYGLDNIEIAKSEDADEDFSNLYVVQFKGSASYTEIYNCVSKYEFDLLSDSSEKVFSLRIDDLNEFISIYDDIVYYTQEPNKRQTFMAANDTLFPEQWALPTLRLPEAWEVTRGDESVLVGVIDTGIYRLHEDFKQSSILQGYDLVRGRPDVRTDLTGHGTAVTSVIAAHSNNNLGMTGTCWDISIIPYNVENSAGLIYSSTVVNAIRMAADAGCDVINISLGGYEFDEAEKAAVDYAISKGSIIVAAAGNEGSKGLVYPASYDGVISVGSINRNLLKSSFSQVNSKIDVCAPGEDIIAATINQNSPYGVFSGTSFSAPYVAGIAALARSIEEDIDWIYFEHLLMTTSTSLSIFDQKIYYGWGLINAEKIVNEALLPIVIGVENYAVYETGVNILFNTGTATLNGIEIQSNTLINKSGNYRLKITNSKGRKSYVNFTIGKTPLLVSGVANDGIYNTDRAVTFQIGTATLNSKPFESGSVITDEGDHTLVLEGPNGDKAVFNFEIDKTSPIVKGVSDGQTYDRPVKINYYEWTATLNGKAIEPGEIVSKDGDYKLAVRDRAGNNTIIDFTIKNKVAKSKELVIPQGITQWTLNDYTKEIYAISFEGKSFMIIDSDSMIIKKQIPLESSPTDLFKEDDKVYISLPASKKILEYDIAKENLEITVSTEFDPFRFVKYNNLIFYVREHQTGVYAIDMETNTETWMIAIASNSALAINSELGILYVGKGSDLIYFDINRREILDGIYGNDNFKYFAKRRIYFDGNRVYYSGYAFNPESMSELPGDYNTTETVLKSYDGMVFTNKSVYDMYSKEKIGDYCSDFDLSEISPDGKSLFFYDKNNTTVIKFDSMHGSVNKDNIIDIIGGVPFEGIAFSKTGRRLSDARTDLEIGVNIDKWIIDDKRNMLYAISFENKAMFFINSVSLDIVQTIIFVSKITDYYFDGNCFYLAFLEANRIEVVDAETYSIINTFHTKEQPVNLVKDDENIYYISNKTRNLNELNMSTRIEKITYTVFASAPKLEINKDLNLIYVGRFNTSSLYIDYYHTIEKWIKRSPKFSRFGGLRHNDIFLDEDYLQYCGYFFDPANPDIILGKYPDNAKDGFSGILIFSKGNYVFSNTAMYDKQSFEALQYFKSKIHLVEMSDKNDLYLYDINKKVIMRMLGDRDAPPVVSGVENNEIIIDQAFITFNKGTATLNGLPFASGSKVTEGEYTLIVRSPDCDDIVINFVVYKYTQQDKVPVIFADEKLKQALIKKGVDKNGDGIISRGEMKILTGNLSLDFMNISNISGIEYAFNLTGIDLSGNRVSDFKILSQLKNLRNLSLAQNDILDIESLGDLSKLVTLDVSGNKISFLDNIDKLLYLKNLDLSDNEIADIDSLLFLRLTNLDVSSNFLTINEWSDDFLNIRSLMEIKADILYTPQKSIDFVVAPQITINPYDKSITNKDITVTAYTDRGKLNTLSHKFTSNGSFNFIATDSIGNVTVKNVTISNIDKNPPEFILKSENKIILPGSNVFSDVEVSYKDDNIEYESLKVYKNSKTITWPENGIFTSEGSYSISIKDKAGNSSSISFKISSPGIPGDSNNDGVIDVTDILRIRAHIIGKSKMSAEAMKLSDVNGDGAIDVTDILLIRAMILRR